MKAIWNGKVIAESQATISLEGNAYFPPESVNMQFFKSGSYTSFCPWKGTASYWDVIVDEKTNKNAAWYYPDPFPKADHIKGYIAFWRGIQIEQ